ncbi:KAP family P-loop NTPase fold protein [Mucilaginibacter sp. KACC 22063]|uniref:KAP family P-loop NTPase fold protein n=1 Tax=Mucilaginibacter sp. KACC 22063 TaxID=3025666 RepID=UPI002365FE4E|nr:P-loop NTPase fold protein [Mucilaginibacter sp. KACC 22063]WDF57209.1 P-loop NTPase fold protein [Mucilaginibacter sp. KACC 22063]
MPQDNLKTTNENWLIRLRKLLTHQCLIGYALPLLIFILLHHSIEEFLSLLVVKPLLSKIGSTNINNALFFLVAGYALLLFISRANRFVPSGKAFTLQVILMAIYLFYRNHQTVWQLQPLKGFTVFYYTDLIFEIVLLNGMLLLRQSLPAKKIEQAQGFHDDGSLGKNKPDLLGYEPYVRTLSSRILQTNPETAIAVGINGRWGSGKTSFFDLLKRHMTDVEIIVIDFDPWNSLSPKSIIKDFFETVRRAIRPYHSQLPRLLDNYTDKLINLHSEGLGKVAKELKSVIVPGSSLNDLYEQINKEIKAIGRKIIIYIDDLDRLDKEEIAEVIRLIRNTANFSYTFFIVAYDRGYVLNAIKSMNAFNHTHFLEKIFQIEVNLPYFNPAIIQRKLADLLKVYYHQEYHETIEKEIVSIGSSIPQYFAGWIETLRDVTRLNNGITLNLDQLLTEVVFSEFVRLEILRLKFPSVYEAFYRNTTTFLYIPDKHNSTNGYQLKSIGDESEKMLGLSKEHSAFELFLRQNAERLSVEQYEIGQIVALLDGLFGVSRLTARFRSHLSVVHPSRFELYFSYSLLEGKLSEADFVRATQGDITSFKAQIDQWNRKNMNFEVLRRFLQLGNFKDRKEFETVVAGIFYFARQSDNNSQFGYEDRQLANLLRDDRQRLSKKFYNGKQEDYAAFIQDLFSDAVYPFTFDSTFLEYLNKSFDPAFPIDLDDRLLMVIDLFRRYVSNFAGWDYNLWRLYHACSYKDWTPTGEGSYRGETIYPEEANRVMTETIGKQLESFLPMIIDFPPFVDDQMYFSGVIKTIFGSYESFGEFLDKYEGPTTPALVEFRQFYQKLAENNFANAVTFEFKNIKVVNRGTVN